MVAFATFLTLSGVVAGQDFAVRGSDGSWYTASSKTSTVEKRSADLATLYWAREAALGEIRSLRATPDGGVAMLTAGAFRSVSLGTWDGAGESRLQLSFLMNSPRMAVDGEGDILIAGDSLRLLRLNRRGVLVKESATGAVPVSSLGGMELGPNGRLYLAGSTNGLMSASPGAYQTEARAGLCQAGGKIPAYRRCESGWVGSFDANSFEQLALSYLGGADENWLTGLAIDRSGNPLVVGRAEPRLFDREPFPRTETAAAPFPRTLRGEVMTISRMSPELDRLIDSTWLVGSLSARAVGVELDESDRVIVTGSTVSPDFPGTRDWTTVCGPLGTSRFGFGLRLDRSLSQVEGVVLLGEVLAPRLIDFGTRAICVLNSGSFSSSREIATGQLVTLIGGPFRESDTLEVRGVQAPVLYRSESQINFVVPRGAGTGSDLALTLSGRIVRRMDISGTRPTWIYNLLEIAPSAGFLRSSINARRPDGTLNERANRFVPGEEIRAYATGIDLNQSLSLLDFNDRNEFGAVTASYVPGSFDSVVEFRFENRGVPALIIVNGRVESSAGSLWVVQ